MPTDHICDMLAEDTCFVFFPLHQILDRISNRQSLFRSVDGILLLGILILLLDYAQTSQQHVIHPYNLSLKLCLAVAFHHCFLAQEPTVACYYNV